ncbi:MAG: hypothetical protein VR70_14470 [Rhodospirillaceae bacterium BRH_c57]|nr:MAG: hypothetical protein VR70_14470 [Rhodospirillaceae bacterium BRH_c57]
MDKPREGEACNGCGVCCQEEVCSIGIKIAGDVPAPCPLLKHHDGRHWCGAVEAEAEGDLPPIIRTTLGIGLGCDSSDDTEADSA